MAKVRFGPLVSDIAGAVGGVVFRKNNGGPTLQILTKSSKPMTEAQSFAQGISAGAAKLWVARSVRDIRSWENWASQHLAPSRSGGRRPPNIFGTYMRRETASYWTQGVYFSTRVTIEPEDTDTFIRMFYDDIAHELQLRCYSAAPVVLSAGWVKVVPIGVSLHARKPFMPLWSAFLNRPITWSTGADSYGNWVSPDLWQAQSYLNGLFTGSAYAYFRVMARLSIGTYAYRDLGPVTLTVPF